jgi:Asp-tRNA(Asn)/Glu-tRNA(Gln) amidotransferase A subunit family amidase
MASDAQLTARDYAKQYRDGERSPEDVVEAAIAAVRLSDQQEMPLGAFVVLDEADVRRQAAESARRIERGEARSLLDGVPVAIKDEFDVEGFATTAGTIFRGKKKAKADAAVVERLREAGAVIFGKTAMHEIGFGGTGINPKHITARNPHDLNRAPGGSSSGSAAAVAAGLCPIALGSDAGGSVRIPAAFSGIYGLKPTYGRIPTTGGALLAWSLDHLGPLAASVDDLAIFYDLTAGAHPSDEETHGQPAPDLVGELDPPDMSDLRIAWTPEMGEDALGPVKHSFLKALGALRREGAVVDERSIAHIAQAQRVGYVTMAAEAAATQRDWLVDHRADYNWDTRLLLAVGERISTQEYLHAQRVRTIVCREFAKVFEDYDFFVTPTTGMVAPEITDAAMEAGEVNSKINAYVSRYTFLGNVSGYPAVSVPCGVDSQGLPIGLMIYAAPWKERELLNAAAAIDQVVDGVGRPSLFFEV